ncbi:hypothetical protein [Bradyrhizobium jicamae]|uniref:hypothetical protein n=1 Tax=Bradyrhizobium jicamae TaxID=280332 RepID=UPI001BAE1EBB|nr:hypothetical protein [Bradyrhizobium jicamae]MBR0937300.1 hypothetical protein [Bradyrhizobium jicamae]
MATDDETLLTGAERKRAGGLEGSRRAKEVPAEIAKQREELAQRLAADLGRPATAIDGVAIEQLASLVTEARRLEARGRWTKAMEIRHEIAIAIKSTGLRPEPPVAAKSQPESMADYLKRTAEAS